LLLLGRMAWECAMSLRSEEEIILGQVLLEKEGGALRRLRKWFGLSDPQHRQPTTTTTTTAATTITGYDNLGEWLENKKFKMPSSNLTTTTTPSSNTKGNNATPTTTPTNTDIAKKRVYFRLLHLHPIHVNLSFRFTALDPVQVLSLSKFRVASAIRGEAASSTKAFGFSNSNSGLAEATFDADYVAALLPPALTNIDGARIRLYALIAPHVLADTTMLSQQVSRHYGRQALTQVYRIIGSSDLFGNPLGALQDISAALQEFVERPVEGLSRASPTAFIRGVGSGTSALLRHALTGTFDALAKLSGALGAGVALLSLDHRFIAERWTQLRFEQPSGVGTGFMLGFRGFANSLVDGTSGIITRPVRSLETFGLTSSAAQEFGLGVLGAGVKPIVGVLDFAGRTATGARNSIQSLAGSITDRGGRVRLPRAFHGVERRMDSYVEEDAFIATLFGAVYEAVIYASSDMTGGLQRHYYQDNDAVSSQVVVDYLGHVLLDQCFVLVLGGERLWCLDWSVWVRKPISTTTTTTTTSKTAGTSSSNRTSNAANKQSPINNNNNDSNPTSSSLADATIQTREMRIQLGNKARVWDVPLEDVLGVRYSREPSFPHVIVLIRTPSSFVRTRKRDGNKGGAGNAELVVGDITAGYEVNTSSSPTTTTTSSSNNNNVPRAAIRFDVISHGKSKSVERKIRQVCGHNWTITSSSTSSPRAVSSGSLSSPSGSASHQLQRSSTPPTTTTLPNTNANNNRILGVALGPVPSSMMYLAGEGHVGGAGVVLRVVLDSPAQRAGLRVGDIVVSCGGISLDRDDPGSTLRRTVAKNEPTVVLHVVRAVPGNRLSLRIVCVF
jgi:hypothetical protein